MIEKIKLWWFRRWALKGLKKKYYQDIAVNEVMKDWITACIIDRKQEFRRKELIESKAGLKEMELFRNWIKTQK